MQSAKPVATPVDPGTKLVKADESDESYNQSEYQSAVGACYIYPLEQDQILRLL